MAEDSGFRVAFLVANEGVEQVELEVPWRTAREQGWSPELLAPEPGFVHAMRHLDHGDDFPVDRTVGAARPGDYDALVLPGGQINPDKLRLEPKAIEIIRGFLDSGKVVAAICHAPWLLIEAGAVKGRRLTSYQSIKTDVINAGGDWRDEVVVTDRGIITSRSPADLEPFVAKIIEEVREGSHARRPAAE